MPSHSAMCLTNAVNGNHNNNESTAVTTLNNKCAIAKRWPPRSLPSMPTTAVAMLLPTLEPIAKANAWIKLICPPDNAANVRISVA